MAHHYDALMYEGRYDFTIAFPHVAMPSDQELGDVTWAVDDQIRMLLEQQLRKYCAVVGDVYSNRAIYNGDSDWSRSQSGDDDN